MIFVPRVPADLMVARSGIIFIVQELPAPVPAVVAYDLLLYVWRGDPGSTVGADSYRLRRYPIDDPNNPGETLAVFDVSRIVQGYFSDLDYNLPLETTGNLALNIQAEASYFDGTNDRVSPTIGDVLQVQYGWNPNTYDVNYNFSPAVFPSSILFRDGFLTDAVNITMPRDGYLSLFIRHTGTLGGVDASETESIKIVNLSPPLIGTFIDVVTPFPPTDSSETLLRFGVGYQDLIDAGWTPGDKYEVWCADGTGGGGAQILGTTKIIITIEDECKYETHKIDFINRFGVWDRIFTYGANTQATEVEASDAMRYVQGSILGDDTWRQGDGQYTVFNKMGRDSITLNTGWVSEDTNFLYEQLFMSERVVVDGVSAVLTDKRFVKKTVRNDKLINYTFTFEFAFTKANTIG